jgi:two-component system phosphate regulon sensor histidine kinase PhoR
MSVHECVVEFFVADTGMGIPKKELPKIFDNFYRGEQALNYAIRGNGLGLCITKELVELMGGTISVQSEVKQGSKFYFTVPFKSNATHY